MTATSWFQASASYKAISQTAHKQTNTSHRLLSNANSATKHVSPALDQRQINAIRVFSQKYLTSTKYVQTHALTRPILFLNRTEPKYARYAMRVVLLAVDLHRNSVSLAPETINL